MEHMKSITPKDARAPFDFAYSEKVIPVLSSPKENDAVLSDKWYVKNETGSELCGRMAERFCANMKKAWGVELCGNSFPISLSLVSNEKEEYHEIIIEKDSITIKAGGESGILRALYRLEDLATASGGPFFAPATYVREPVFVSRYIYSFCGLYERGMDVDSRTYCPDEMLEQYSRCGVNGIWLQGILYRLTEFPFDPEKSTGWQMRQKNLLDFVNRAKEYGIKIFLYINEPRAMPHDFFEKHPHLAGSKKPTLTSMCISEPETQEYLRNGIESLCRAVPGLGGFFTITMSENFTHCKSSAPRFIPEPCPKCADKRPYELVAKVNNIIAEAAHSVDPSILVIAWDWGWDPNFGFAEDEPEKCIDAMSDDVVIMAKRETDVPFCRGGVSGKVRDYSISVSGLSKESLRCWNHAKKRGLQTAAKVQINNTWECSTTPYIPVYRMLFEQMNSLLDLGIDHLMLSWTLGGYPSPGIKVLSECFFSENGSKGADLEKSLRSIYADKTDTVKAATDLFCDAFEEFPFHLDTLYLGPQNGGASNLLYHEPTNYTATMTCYSYDDLESWRSIYPVDVFENQLKKVCDKWQEGLKLLDMNGDEFSDISFISYSLFAASYNQVHFTRLRNEYLKTPSADLAKEMVKTLQDEKELTLAVYRIMCRRPEVGFEAANHYYFSLGNLREKIINCDWLIELYSK